MRAVVSLFVLCACQQREIPAGFRSDLTSSLEGCGTLAPDVQDWCLIAMLKLGGDLPEAPATSLCDSMDDPAAKDNCLELVAREAASLSNQRICEGIIGERMRSSCWLTIADRLMSIDPDINVIIDACGRSGDNLIHCLSHIPERRGAYWMAHGGLDLVRSDLNIILTAAPLANDFVDLGAGLARAAPTLGFAGSQEICELLPTGGVRVGCEGTMRLAAGGDNGSGMLAPGAPWIDSMMGQGPGQGPSQGGFGSQGRP